MKYFRNRLLNRFLIIILLVLFFPACSVKIDKSGSAAEGASVPHSTGSQEWYYLNNGILISFEDFDKLPGVEMRPWTVQSRIAGFLQSGTSLYIGINGYGLASLDLNDRSSLFKDHANRLLFPGRTIGSLFSRKGEIVCHLFRNTVFNTSPPGGGGISLIIYKAYTASFKILPLLFQERNPDWECVELLNDTDGNMYIVWKCSNNDKTEFRFSRIPGPGFEGEAITREEFVTAYGFRSMEKAPRILNNAAGKISGDGGFNTVIHFYLRNPGNLFVERYTSGNEAALFRGETGLVIVKALRSGGICYALLPSGNLLFNGTAGTEDYILPSLPENFVYTDFWTNGDLLLASWEEQSFTNSGRAGIFLDRGFANSLD